MISQLKKCFRRVLELLTHSVFVLVVVTYYVWIGITEILSPPKKRSACR